MQHSSRSVQIIHATLNKALKQAVAWLLIPRNPAESSHPLKAPAKEIAPLTEEQTKAFLEAAKGNKLEALYLLAITTGMRQGELLGIQWKDLDLDLGVLKVRRTVYNGRVHPPKTKKGERRIALAKRP